jgi:outer membrane receptor for ferrienterochelin and colicin
MIWTGLTVQPNNAVLDMIQPSVNVGRKYKHTGGYKDRWIQPELFVQFKKQTWVEVSYIWSKELFKDVLVDGIERFQVETGTSFSGRLTASAYVRQGNSVFRRTDTPFLAKERTIEAEAVFRPTSRLSLATEYLYQRFDQLDGTDTAIPQDDHKEYSLRNKLTYQFSKRLFFRIIGQYVKQAGSGGAVEFDPLVSYKINPFSVFFIGSTHNFTDYGSRDSASDADFQQTERTFFVKFQYLFRI